MEKSVKENFREFLEWQQRPYQVAPLSEEEHDCPTCQTHYTGNFCPRCGQAAKIGRYSFKTALLLFVDVWGLGNRGMFRTLRDLLLRPGYMIRDYLQGMQMAYFPPFKMFFLLTALSLMVNHGLNIKGEQKDQMQALNEQLQAMNEADMKSGSDADAESEDKQTEHLVNESLKLRMTQFLELQESYPNLISLATLICVSGLLYVPFRHTKTYPGLRYSEFLIACIYSENMHALYTIPLDFFCVEGLNLASLAVVVIPLKQFLGFSWLKVIFWFALGVCLLFLLIILAVLAFMFADVWSAMPAG